MSASGTWATGDGHDPQGFDYWDVLIDQGEYWNPRFLSAGRAADRARATRPTSSPTWRCDWLESPRGRRAVVRADLPQGAAPPVGAQPRARGPVHRARPGAGRPSTTTTRPGRSSARRAAMRLAENLTAEDLKQDPPEGLSYEETALLEVPALHGGLPAPASTRSTRTSAGSSTGSRERGRLRRHAADVRLRPGLLPRRPRLVRQAVHVRGVAADAARAELPAPGPGRAGARRAS